jgi:hypothetical protein
LIAAIAALGDPMKFNLLASILFASALTLGAVLAQAAIPTDLTKASAMIEPAIRIGK